jgi:hypothetical protein
VTAVYAELVKTSAASMKPQADEVRGVYVAKVAADTGRSVDAVALGKKGNAA